MEAELENHNQEAKRSYQAMEEQFHKVKVDADDSPVSQHSPRQKRAELWKKWCVCVSFKVHYEQHICALQQRLEAANVATELDGHRAQVQSLEEELQRVRRGHQEREKSLQDVVAALQQQLKHKVSRLMPWITAHVHSIHTINLMLHSQARSISAGREPHTEGAFRVRIERLNQELSAKTRTIQELSRSVDRLEKEKRNALTVSSSQTGTEKQRAETREQPGAARKHPSGHSAAEKTFPVAGYQKPYKPTIFEGTSVFHPSSAAQCSFSHLPNLQLCSPLPRLSADSHIWDFMQENEALRERLQLLEVRSEQEKEALKEEVAQAREELLR